MTNNLPVKSEKRMLVPVRRELAIVNARPIKHIRKYRSGRVAVVNPQIVPKYQVIKSESKSLSTGFENKIQLRPRQAVDDWKKFLTVDTGVARPISSPKNYSFDMLRERILNLMDTSPSRNEEDFYKEWVDDPVKKLLDEIAAKTDNEEWMLDPEVDERVVEIAKDADAVIYDDENSPSATIVYSEGAADDERGYISTYTGYNAEGIDVKWVNSGGYRGYNDVVIDPDGPWEGLHEDNILSMSNDESNLKSFSDALEAELDARNISHARIFTTTSNVFSNGLTHVIEKGRRWEVKAIIDNLDKLYRKTEDYMREINPLYEGVQDAKARGLSKDQIRNLLKNEIKSDELKKMFEDALK